MTMNTPFKPSGKFAIHENFLLNEKTMEGYLGKPHLYS